MRSFGALRPTVNPLVKAEPATANGRGVQGTVECRWRMLGGR